MLSEMSSSSLAGWADYATREPFGPPSWDARIGHVLAVLVNAITGQETHAADYTPRWGPRIEADPPAQDWRSIRAVVREWKNAHHR